MADSVLYGLVQEVLKNLGSNALNEIASAWGFNDELEKLKDTINTVKNKLLDAEERQADNGPDSHAIRDWLERLTTVVYEADDLFDEYNTTVASHKQLMGRNNFTAEEQTFLSSNNQLKHALCISQKIKSIQDQLDCIVKDSTNFNFVPRPHEKRRVMNRRMREETSFVHVDEVIGRDDDKKIILDKLLASSSIDEEQHITVIPIVGMGGMGKTTLAQLIFNDPQVKEYFEMSLWVCVSEVFDIKEIAEKILKSAIKAEIPTLEMEQLQGQLRKEIGDKKYLLVLDDVWNEDHYEWLNLVKYLKVGKKGSKILVTTRSTKVATKMGALSFHELQGLSEEKSWDLFKKVAFVPGQAQQKSHLVKVGQDIVKKCGNVPLAIKALGSLLKGEDENVWLSLLKEKSLANMSTGDHDNGIINILKLSYHHLRSPLKNCFAYCALFPKDYVFVKERLIDLWMAEGFVIPKNEYQSLDEAAQDYFQTLLQRCFFQDVTRNGWGAITRCKMHDLMHDLAQQVAGVRCKHANSTETDFDDKIIHLSFAYHLTSSWEIPNGMLNSKMLRTFLLLEQTKHVLFTFNESICQQLTTRFSCLRVLDLHCLNLKSLHSSIGKLIHLRNLNLSETDIEELPDSITDLHNLQTLNLYSCRQLRTLPENIRKLVNLRSLDVSHCYKLSHMPSGIARLTSMNRLPTFIVRHKAKLSDLKELNSLRGELYIEIKRDYEKNMLEEAMEAELINKQGLTVLKILIFSPSFETTVDDRYYDEAVLEGLKPHSKLRELSISGYGGQKLPSWARWGELCSTLPYLVEIRLDYCCSCEQVPGFSQLRFLKRLYIIGMDRVEYMEDGVADSCSSSSSKSQGMQTLFFPSLEVLELWYMENLKGWWKGVEAIESTNGSESTSTSELVGAGQPYNDDHQFCEVSKLVVIDCPELKYIPQCPKVEKLTLHGNNERFTVMTVLKMATRSASSSGSGTGTGMVDMKLKELGMDNVEHQLKSIPKQCWHQLSSLNVYGDHKLVNTKNLGDVFATLSNSLRSLKFVNCHNLRSISQGLEHLTALEHLSLFRCLQLDLLVNEEEEEEGRNRNMMMPWLAFKSNLRSLELNQIHKMTSFPSGLQHLTNLRYLSLSLNRELTEIPEWISCLSSLEQLDLNQCPKLRYLPQALRNRTSLRLNITNCPGLTQRS